MIRIRNGIGFKIIEVWWVIPRTRRGKVIFAERAGPETSHQAENLTYHSGFMMDGSRKGILVDRLKGEVGQETKKKRREQALQTDGKEGNVDVALKVVWSFG